MTEAGERSRDRPAASPPIFIIRFCQRIANAQGTVRAATSARKYPPRWHLLKLRFGLWMYDFAGELVGGTDAARSLTRGFFREFFQPAAARLLAQLRQSAGFDLTDALAGDLESSGHFVQRLWLAVQ